ncbi:hypothetical protein TWF481_004182 [Arthrobotrys musiformis]|uniref:Uncharacterized protein n=1 Tax=Arthrobotrys musiformis TaxID=47236 RepID=A0AAV9WIW2_9PEZI
MAVIRAEAQSLDTLTRLADNPPLQIRRYPPQPPPHDPHAASSHQLKLYIVRVPNSQDIILTPLKPQCNTVTAQDIVSCLYYLRIQPLEGGNQKPRSQSLQPDHYPTRGTSSFDDATRPSHPRASFSGESSQSDHLVPGGGGSGGYMNPSSSSIHSVGAGPMPTSTDFEITFIRRDRTTGSQATIGRIYSNNNSPLVDIPHMPNSYAAQMMHNESLVSKKGKRDRKRLNLEVYTDGYRKFVCGPQRTARTPVTPATLGVPDTTRPSTATSDGGESVSSRGDGYLWPAPVPPPPPGFEDVGPPPPPKDPARSQQQMMMSPAMSRVSYQSRFTEVYSPDSPNPSIRRSRPQQQQSGGSSPAVELPEQEDESDGIFKRTLFLQGEGFWKSTGKRLSAFSASHRRKRSDSPGSYNRQQQQQSQSQYTVNEETRLAMEQMGLYSTSPNYCPPGSASPDERPDKETKGKGYVFEPPQKGTGTCEFETNGVGRKIRLRLHPPSTMVGSPFGNTAIVKGDPILLSTLSLRPPDADRSPSPSGGSSSKHGHSRGLSKFKFGEKFKKLQRENSWTEQTEFDAGSGLRSKLGSLLVEGEGMDVLDLVVVSSMGVFYRRYCEWTEDLREGGGI